jgi:hypothetical protein
LTAASFSAAHGSKEKEVMGKGILLWLIGIPIPIIILLYIFVFR